MRRTLFMLLLLTSLPLAALEEITVLALFPDRAMLRIDGTQRLLRVGERSPEGVKLLAADSEQATIEYSGEQQRLELGTHISSQFVAAKVKTVQIWPDVNGMYSVNGTINGAAIDFLVDTGATTIALNAFDAKRLNLDYKAKGKRVMVETASGRSGVYLLTLDMTTVGQIKLYNVQAIVFEGAQPSTALLGQSFLNRVEMKRDGVLLTLEQR